MKKFILLSAVIFFTSMNLIAQNIDRVKTSKAQISFGFPIGSNGTNSMEYSNNFSFNILYGLNGGVNGAEIGSIFNYNRGNVSGFQLAGVSNICTDSTSGLLISGVMNYSKGNSEGFQLSAINYTANKFKGLQLGVMNYANKVKGVQLGVVNILGDEEEVIPVGLINIVKNGYYGFELNGGEVLYSSLKYKMGVDKFYTVYNTGYSSFNNHPVYSFGLGFGGNIPLSDKQIISINLTANGLVYNNNWSHNLNLLNKIDFNYIHNITKKISLLVGPSVNLYVTKEKVNGEYGTLHIPYTILKNEWTDGKLSMWLGINAGLSLKL
jgi:hypothetical protein